MQSAGIGAHRRKLSAERVVVPADGSGLRRVRAVSNPLVGIAGNLSVFDWRVFIVCGSGEFCREQEI